MWARTAEFMIACWLIVSPFIFQHGGADTHYWVTDLVGGTLLATFALLSYWQPTHRAHALTPFLGIGLIAFAFLMRPHPLPPALQNHIMVGLLIIMLGVVPNDALLPPAKWREFDEGRVAPDDRPGGGESASDRERLREAPLRATGSRGPDERRPGAER